MSAIAGGPMDNRTSTMQAASMATLSTAAHPEPEAIDQLD